jgi:hypothetical protein
MCREDFNVVSSDRRLLTIYKLYALQLSTIYYPLSTNLVFLFVFAVTFDRFTDVDSS